MFSEATIEVQTDITAEAREILDNVIKQISGRSLVETSEMIDYLLDARNTLAQLDNIEDIEIG
jgi:hypothetical protein